MNRLLMFQAQNRGGAMVFALGAVAIVGILIASFLSDSQKWLEQAKTKSSGEQLIQKAHSNYERMLPVVLQAMAWGIEARAGSSQLSLPAAPRLLEAYGGELDALFSQLQSCQSPCRVSSDFLSKVYSSTIANSEGWRYRLDLLSNGNFESGAAHWPKRFSLTVFQFGERAGEEVRITGSFVIQPTSLSTFAALAWAAPPSGVVVGHGDLGNVGIFFDLTDRLTGQPISLPESDCADRQQANSSTAAFLNQGTIYLMPQPGKTLEIGTLATNVDISRICAGRSQTTAWGYHWSFENNVGEIKLGGVMTTGSVGAGVKAKLQNDYNAALNAIRSYRPFEPPSELSGSELSTLSSVDKTESLLVTENLAFPQAATSEYFEILASAGKLSVAEAETAKLETTDSLSDVKTEKAKVDTESKETKGATDEKADVEKPLDWRLVRAEIKFNSCTGPDACSVRFSEFYSSDSRQEQMEHLLYEGLISNIPESFKNILATQATVLEVSAGSGLSDSNTIPVGARNLTIMSRASAKLDRSFELLPTAKNLPLTDEDRLGQLAFVNMGEGPAAIIQPEFKTLTGSTLASIKSGSTSTSNSTVTARLDVGLFAMGIQEGARPLALDSSLLEVKNSGNVTFGTLEVAAPQWGADLPLVRVASANLSSYVAGFNALKTEFPKSWERSPVTNVESSKYLSYTEISRSAQVQANFSTRVLEAKRELGIE